ncbi:hypothetical protein WDU94_004259 [Cyamophila willieti]
MIRAVSMRVRGLMKKVRGAECEDRAGDGESCQRFEAKELNEQMFANTDLDQLMTDLKGEMERLKLSNNRLSFKLEENKKHLHKLKGDIVRIEGNIASKDEEIEELTKLYTEKKFKTVHNITSKDQMDKDQNGNEVVTEAESKKVEE